MNKIMKLILSILGVILVLFLILSLFNLYMMKYHTDNYTPDRGYLSGDLRIDLFGSIVSSSSNEVKLAFKYTGINRALFGNLKNSYILLENNDKCFATELSNLDFEININLKSNKTYLPFIMGNDGMITFKCNNIESTYFNNNLKGNITFYQKKVHSEDIIPISGYFKLYISE